MKALLALIKKLYGSKAIQNAIGTRTNVITLPDKDTKRFLTNELNIEAASDAAVNKAFKDAEKLIPELSKLNDQEILTFTGNLQRLDNRLNPPSAPIIDIKTKKPVTGIEKLAEERGFPKGMEPDSPLGQLLQSSRKIDDEIAKAKSTEGGIPFTMVTPKGDVKGTASADELFDMITKNPARSGGPLDPNVGIVRTAARQILRKRLDAGEIDIPDAAERDAIAKGYQGGVDPIEVFRKRFGEDALQDLDEIADELNRARDFNQIDDILKRNKLFDVEPKKDYGYQEGSMTDEELREVLKKSEEDPEGFVKGGRVGYAEGNPDQKQMAMIEDMLKRGMDMDTIKTLTGASDEMIQDRINFIKYGGAKVPIKKAKGGRVEYAVGSGMKLAGFLARKGKDLENEIKKAIDNFMQPSGDNKLDADVILDDMFDELGVDRDMFDQKDVLDAYGEIYDNLNAQKVLLPKMRERFELKEKYPGIDDELLTKIIDDTDPQRKAEVLATLDQSMEMMKQGKSSEEVVDVLKKETRTKQAGGGVAYLMGL